MKPKPVGPPNREIRDFGGGGDGAFLLVLTAFAIAFILAFLVKKVG